MKITTLLENTTIDDRLQVKHGISLFIETPEATILFDTGPDDTFLKNARKMGIDVASVDYLIISHGHADHGGGIDAFLEVNRIAPVICRNSALVKHFAKVPGKTPLDISLDPTSIPDQRYRKITEDLTLSESIRVFSDFQKNGFIPSGNQALFMDNPGGEMIPDTFEHEICLHIREKEKNVLITGCSHSGLGNMIQSVMNKGRLGPPDVVIGGFHLSNPDTDKCEPEENMDRFILELERYPDCTYYTGHCTGMTAYRYLKARMGNRLTEFKTGSVITV